MTFIGACFVKRRRSCNWSFKLILLFLNTVIIPMRDADFVNNIILYYFLLLYVVIIDYSIPVYHGI